MSADKKCNYCNLLIVSDKKHKRECQGKVLKKGKHKNLNYRQILEQQPGYCKFILEELETGDRDYLNFKKWLKSRQDQIIEDEIDPDQKILTIGKYKGQTFEFVYQNDKGYVSWVKNLPKEKLGHFRRFQRWIVKQNDPDQANIISCGKYKGQTFESVFETDKNYADWVLKLEPEKVKEFKNFQQWLKTQPIKEEEDLFVIVIGKYEGAPFEFVLDQDIDFATWVINNVEGGKLMPFKKWLLGRPEFST